MKKLFFIFSTALALASCTSTGNHTSNQKQQLYYPGTETTLVDSCRNWNTVAKPFTTCDGRRSVYPWQIDGGWSYHHTTITTQGRPIGKDSVAIIIPVTQDPSDSSVIDGVTSWLIWPLLGGFLLDFFKFLVFILLVGLIFWALKSLYEWIKSLWNNPDPLTSGSPMVTTEVKKDCKNSIQMKMLEIGEKAVAEGGKKKVFMKLLADGSLEVNINDNNQNQQPSKQEVGKTQPDTSIHKMD